jgi:heptosyltransferase I
MRMPMKEILIVRLSAIGDVVMSTAILAGLRQAWPTAHFHWLTEDMGGEVLKGNTDLASVTVLPRKRWDKLIRERHYLTFLSETRAMRRKVREIGADVAIDAQGLLRSAMWAQASGAKLRIGLRSHEGSQFLMNEVVRVKGNPTGRMCNEYRSLLEYFGLKDAPLAMSLRPTDDARKEARAMIPDGATAPVFFYPFTTRPQKHWFTDRWADLATGVVHKLGRPVWILGGPADEATANEIAKASGVGDNIRVVAGKDSNIVQKMGLIERAGAAIGVDTGLSHMSLGLGTPTVVMFGSTCGYTDTTPLPGIVLYEKMPCSPCRRHPTCNGNFTCMKKITVDEALSALGKLLEGRK